MKKAIILTITTIALICIGILPAFASETGDLAEGYTDAITDETVNDGESAAEEERNHVTEESNAETAPIETEGQNTGDLESDTAMSGGYENETEGSTISAGGMIDIMEVINNAASREDAIIALCEKYGFTVEEAEGYITAFIAFGDTHFSDNSWWNAVRSDIQNNIRTWAVILVVLFAVIVSAIALIINIANKRKQKFQALQMETFCTDMQAKYSSDRNELSKLEAFVYENLKRNTDEVNTFRAMVNEFCESLAEKNDQMLSMKNDITRSREVVESTQKLNETSALYNLQVLYFMMGRAKLPIGDPTSRRLWYQEHQKELLSLMSAEELDRVEKLTAEEKEKK